MRRGCDDGRRDGGSGVCCRRRGDPGEGELSMGPFLEGPQCRLSNLRNGHVPCHYFV